MEPLPPTFSAKDIIGQVPLLSFIQLKPVEPVADDVYSVVMELGPANKNLLGIAHGGAIATLLDHAGGGACGLLLGRGGPTADLHVRYLRASPSASWIRADARILREGRSIIVVEVKATDDEGRLVAVGTMTVAPRMGRPERGPD